jgi:hypothetical protein
MEEPWLFLFSLEIGRKHKMFHICEPLYKREFMQLIWDGVDMHSWMKSEDSSLRRKEICI